MKNKIQNNNNNLTLQNYETLKDELSKILENQRVNKKKTRSNIRDYPKRIYWDSITKLRTFKVKRPTKSAIR